MNLHNVQSESNPLAEWKALGEAFPARQPLAFGVEVVAASSVPEPYKSLLAHRQHMTAMMEKFHGIPVNVRVLARRNDDRVYSREIVLTRQDTGVVVQFAFAQFHLNTVSESVRKQILSEQVPLGRVLVNHKVNCEIELDALFKFTIGTGLSELFGAQVNQVTYGRSARILCDAKPAFDVIEISAPIEIYVSRDP